MWVWDAGAPQLAIDVSRIGNLPHVRITYLSYTTAFPLCCFAHIRSRSTWLRAVKRVPCHVLETRMSHVMDGRVMSRGLLLHARQPRAATWLPSHGHFRITSTWRVAPLSMPYHITTQYRSQVDPFIFSELSPHILAL
jgi:hypothetical protein